MEKSSHDVLAHVVIKRPIIKTIMDSYTYHEHHNWNEAVSQLLSIPLKSNTISNLKKNEQNLAIFHKEDLLHASIGTLAMLFSSYGNMTFPKLMESCMHPHVHRRTLIPYATSLFTLSAIATFIRIYCFGVWNGKIAYRLRTKLYKKMLHQKLSFYQDPITMNTILHRLDSSITHIATSVIEVYASAFRSCNSALGGTYNLFRISPTLTFLSLGALPLLGISTMLLSKRKQKFTKAYEKKIMEMNGRATERLSHMRTVQAFNQELREASEFDHVVDDTTQASIAACTSTAIMKSILSLGINLSLFSLLSTSGALMAKGEIAVGSIASFSMYGMWMGLGFAGLSTCYSDVKKVQASYQDVLELMKEDDDVKVDTTYDILQPTKCVGNLSFSNVTFSYPSRPTVSVLRNTSFEIPQGKTVAIVGESGTGT